VTALQVSTTFVLSPAHPESVRPTMQASFSAPLPTRNTFTSSQVQFREAIRRIDSQCFMATGLDKCIQRRRRRADMVGHVAHVEVAAAGDRVNAARSHVVPGKSKDVDGGFEGEIVAHARDRERRSWHKGVKDAVAVHLGDGPRSACTLVIVLPDKVAAWAPEGNWETLYRFAPPDTPAFGHGTI
jgi:hypothetical protein